MTRINAILSELDERNIARRVGIPHDEARIRYPIHSNTVSDFREFTAIIADYYNRHFIQCVSNGGTLTLSDAAGRAKEILEQHYRRQGGDLISAYNDAHDGTNGGLRAVLDIIADAMKSESVERYIREVFDIYVAPNSWEEKVEIIRQFIAACQPHLSSAIQADQPERYAQNYNELIRSYVKALQQNSSMFRKL